MKVHSLVDSAPTPEKLPSKTRPFKFSFKFKFRGVLFHLLESAKMNIALEAGDRLLGGGP
jgi:hypothetical protein